VTDQDRRTDEAGAEALRGMRGARVMSRADGTLLEQLFPADTMVAV
jgi:hypothetical protein